MGLPVTLVALLISVEPLIDMGRTALNVSGSMTAGTLTSQWLKQLIKTILDSDDNAGTGASLSLSAKKQKTAGVSCSCGFFISINRLVHFPGESD